MENAEFYARAAVESNAPEAKRAALQLATIAALHELTQQLDEVKALLKEIVK